MIIMVLRVLAAFTLAAIIMISTVACSEHKIPNGVKETSFNEPTYTGQGEFREFCVNGVVYYNMFHHGMAPAYKRDGSLYLCE